MKNKCILVTGANGTLGTALVEHLIKNEVHVAAVGRSTRASSKLCTALTVDLLSPNAAHDVISQLQEQDLSPVGFVHAARNKAFLTKDSEHEIALSQWLSEYQLAVPIAYQLSQALVQMPHSQLESIVLASSIYGCVAQLPRLYEKPELSMVPQYGAAKAALIQLTKSLAVALSPAVRVNAVSFGGIRVGTDAALQKRYGESCPQGRMLELPEVVGPISFLLSKDASGITGQNIIVDGGWTAW